MLIYAAFGGWNFILMNKTEVSGSRLQRKKELYADHGTVLCWRAKTSRLYECLYIARTLPNLAISISDCLDQYSK